MFDLIEKYAGLFLTTVLGSWLGTYIGSYLKKKGENLATHEDIDKLVDQVAAVTTTTKEIESKISNAMWRRERKSDLQLKTIESVSVLTTDFIQRRIADDKYLPTVEWYSALSVADGAVKALFDADTYKCFKALEILIGPDPPTIFVVSRFIETRDSAIKAMYCCVFDDPT